MKGVIALAFCLLFAGLISVARAGEVWQAGNYTFSDELGGFEILAVYGSGTEDDPIVIEQRIMQIGPSVVVIRAAGEADDWKDTRYSPFLQISIVTVVINASRRVWAGFDLELQEQLGKPSVYRDGLSFDQLHTFDNRVFESDRFETFTDLTEPYDRVRFEHGSVDPGETARFSMFITDVTPSFIFYLLQEPQLLIAQAPGKGRRFAQLSARGR